MSQYDIKATLDACIQLAGQIIKEKFTRTFQVDFKGTINNLVTEVDQECERQVIGLIRERFPEHNIIGEESAPIENASDYSWIIDPIDGTVNFAHGIPICCVSIGVMYQNEMVLGAVFNPMMNELFEAEKGKGATLNGRPIHVSLKSDFKKAFLVTGFPYVWNGLHKKAIQIFERFILEGLPVRRLGSAALDLCWVACGRFDGFWEYNLNPWDVSAGYLIVAEAGGKITNFSGEDVTVFDKETLATNGYIHANMLEVLNSVIIDNEQ